MLHVDGGGQGCATKLLWMRVQGGVMEKLAGTTLAELVAFSAVHTRAVALPMLPDPKEPSVPELEIRNLHVAGRRQADPQGSGPDRRARRGPRAHGPQRLGQVHAGQRDHGPPGVRGHRGEIIFNGQDITEADPDERARLGLFMAFQYPVAIPGVTITKYLRMVMNAHRDERGEDESRSRSSARPSRRRWS